MRGAITRARANWAVDRATSLPEVWAIVAGHPGLVGVAADAGVQGGARGGEGISGHASDTRRVRGAYRGW
jgi:hypothetical protein